MVRTCRTTKVNFGANANGWTNLAAVSNTYTIDPLLGRKFRCTALAANATFANPLWKWDGAEIWIRIVQDGTGGRTITPGSDFETGFFTGIASGANAPTILRGIYRRHLR